MRAVDDTAVNNAKKAESCVLDLPHLPTSITLTGDVAKCPLFSVHQRPQHFLDNAGNTVLG